MTAAVVALYLIPFAVAWLARGARDPRAWELAIDIPAVFAVDLIGILLLTLVVPLDWAIVASRPIWFVVAAELARRRRIKWPCCIDAKATALVALAAAFGVFLSLLLSRGWTLWDRRWHMPLVTSMQGQRLPF